MPMNACLTSAKICIMVKWGVGSSTYLMIVELKQGEEEYTEPIVRLRHNEYLNHTSLPCPNIYRVF